MKKAWLFVPVVATIIVLGVVVGGVAQAQGGAPAGTSAASDFASRVATILGLDSTQVQTAMDQAKKDMRDAALQQRLNALVQSGQLTQAQADEYRTWLQSKPAGAPGMKGLGFGGDGHHFNHRGHRGEGSGASYRFNIAPSTAAPTTGVAQ